MLRAVPPPGIDDVLLKSSAEAKRAGIIERAEGIATAASADFVKAGLPEGLAPQDASPKDVQSALSMAYRTNASTGECSPPRTHTHTNTNIHTHTYIHKHTHTHTHTLARSDTHENTIA
jgi:hypothetical protein